MIFLKIMAANKQIYIYFPDVQTVFESRYYNDLTLDYTCISGRNYTIKKKIEDSMAGSR